MLEHMHCTALRISMLLRTVDEVLSEPESSPWLSVVVSHTRAILPLYFLLHYTLSGKFIERAYPGKRRMTNRFTLYHNTTSLYFRNKVEHWEHWPIATTTWIDHTQILAVQWYLRIQLLTDFLFLYTQKASKNVECNTCKKTGKHRYNRRSRLKKPTRRSDKALRLIVMTFCGAYCHVVLKQVFVNSLRFLECRFLNLLYKWEEPQAYGLRSLKEVKQLGSFRVYSG